MRSSIFHSNWSGTGWSDGDNRWSQLFRWPGKSSNRPGRRIARRTKNIQWAKKKKEEKKGKRKVGDYTFASLWSAWIFTNFFETMTPLSPTAFPNGPGDRGFPLWRQFWSNICRTEWKSRSQPVTIDRFFISYSFYVYVHSFPESFQR